MFVTASNLRNDPPLSPPVVAQDTDTGKSPEAKAAQENDSATSKQLGKEREKELKAQALEELIVAHFGSGSFLYSPDSFNRNSLAELKAPARPDREPSPLRDAQSLMDQAPSKLDAAQKLREQAVSSVRDALQSAKGELAQRGESIKSQVQSVKLTAAPSSDMGTLSDLKVPGGESRDQIFNLDAIRRARLEAEVANSNLEQLHGQVLSLSADIAALTALVPDSSVTATVFKLGELSGEIRMAQASLNREVPPSVAVAA